MFSFDSMVLIRRVLVCTLLLVPITAISVATASGSGDGTADTTFATNGLVVQDFVNHNDIATDVVTQPDGKIVIVGMAYSQATNNDVLIARYNSNGTRDTSFNGTGFVLDRFGTSADDGKAVVLQPDGKILVGVETYIGSKYSFGLARFNPDGTSDGTFGAGGQVVTSVSSVADYLFDVVLQPDGKILALGSTTISSQLGIAVVRYNTDGSLDGTFGTNGITNATYMTGNDVAWAMTLQSDGQIILCGRFDNKLGALRLSATGTLDTSFGTNGYFSDSSSSSCNDVQIQSDGKIVLVGTKSFGMMNSNVVVARLTTSGILDTSFGAGGLFLPSVGSVSQRSSGESITVQSDGKLLIGGQTRNSDLDTYVMRVTPSGGLDSTFNSTGIAFADSGTAEYTTALVLQSDSKIVQVGFTSNLTNDIFLARFHNSVVAPPSNSLPSQVNTTPTTAPAVQAVALTTAPSPLAYRAANKKVTLRWRAVEGAASYVVTTTSGTQRCSTVATSCAVSRLRNGRAYNYLVYSVNADGVRSENSTRLTARPGFQVKRTTLKAKRTLKLSSIVTTPSKGAKTWRVTSGRCRIQGTRVVAAPTTGTCKLRLATAKRGSYPAMSTTISISVTR